MRRTIYDVDHESFREAVREFLRREAVPFLDRYRADRHIDRSLWLAAGRQGLLGLEIPAENGGAGIEDYRFNSVLLEELASVSMALASSLSIHFDVVVPYLVHLARSEKRSDWLAAAATGELVCAIGMTEPSTGSDLASLKTSARAVDGGWLLRGSKTFITNGFSADLVVVAARTGPERGARGISLFAVEDGTPGFTRGRKLDKIGQHEADTAELFFEDAFVPESHLIGELGSGFAHMMARLPQERIGAAIANLAHARSIFIETLDYVKERRAFGSAIGSFQHNKFLIAELATELDVAQSFIDGCVEAQAQGELSAIDAAKAKLHSADLQNRVIDHCLQLHGGYGYMEEYRVARAWQDARVTRIWAGSNEIMNELIGRDLGL
jgi:alkylation response protein AidB-like acyl-CoA dehydrogenase